MGVTIEDIKKLKELTGVGLTDAKQALVAADGNFDKALEEMRKKGLTKAEKKGDRETREGLIEIKWGQRTLRSRKSGWPQERRSRFCISSEQGTASVPCLLMQT